MQGGYLQLYAYDKQDAQLTNRPDTTFFKLTYKRHTHFANEHIEFPFNVKFGASSSMTLKIGGDLVSKMTLRVNLPDITGEHVDRGTSIAWVRRLGHAIIKEASTTIDGVSISKYTGVWLDILYELTHSVDQERGYCNLIGDISELTALHPRKTNNVAEIVLEGRNIYVPFQFWFNRSSGLSLPLFLLKQQDVKINVEFEDISKLLVWRGLVPPRVANLVPKDAGIITNQIFLEKQESNYFHKQPPSYLIEQLQFHGEDSVTGTSGIINDQKYKLNFSYPTKELIFAIRLGAFNGESNKNIFNGARGRFITYTHTDNWDAALQYAACNIVRGMIWFKEPETKYGKISSQDWVRLDGNDVLSEINLENCESQTVRICLDNCRYFTLTFVNKTASDELCQNTFMSGTGSWGGNTELTAGNVSITGQNVPSIWILKRNVAVVSDKYDLSTFIHEATVEIGLRRDSNGILHGSVDCVSVNLPNPDGKLDHTLSLCDVSIPVDDWITDNRSTTYEFDKSGHRNAFDVVVTQPHNYGVRLDGKGNPLYEGSLQINGRYRIDAQRGDFFNYIQPLHHHHRTPADGINVYSFAIEPEKNQPSGHVNFTQAKSALLFLKFRDPFRYDKNVPTLDMVKDTKCCIFAVSYNKFKCTGSGRGFIVNHN